MNTRSISMCALVVMTLGPVAPATAGGGVGVLGDSYSDEYQFYSPHRDTARGWVEILAKTRGVDFGEFRTSTWGEPRNQGFAYNWAKSGATTGDMIASGQHVGLAEQVAKGDVEVAVIFVGGNDFIEGLRAPHPNALLEGLGGRASKNVKVASDAILAASPNVRILIATVPDVRDLPEFHESIVRGELSPAIAAKAAKEVEAFNDEVRRMAAPGSRVAIFDFAKISRISQILSPRYVSVAGRMVERDRAGNSPECLFLADRRHLGTMGQGMLAKIMVDVLNKKCGTAIKPLEEREIAALSDALSGSRTDVAEAMAVKGQPRRLAD